MNQRAQPYDFKIYVNLNPLILIGNFSRIRSSWQRRRRQQHQWRWFLFVSLSFFAMQNTRTVCMFEFRQKIYIAIEWTNKTEDKHHQQQQHKKEWR